MKRKVVILGAGIAGLSAAWKLLKTSSDTEVVLIERDPLPGGLARSIEWRGHILDLGPHRFHTEIPEIKTFVQSFCKPQLTKVKRFSRMYLNGCYIPYPVKPLPTFKALGWRSAVALTASALGVLFQRRTGDAQSYQEYVERYYGRGLYERIFDPLTRKVWGIAPDEIAAEAARVRLRGENIWHALKDGLFSGEETYVAEFLYPAGGIGQIAQRFAQEIVMMGGQLILNHEINSVRHDGQRILEVEAEGPKGKQSFPCDRLINTIPLPVLVERFSPALSDEVRQAATALEYRALTLLFLLYDENLEIEDTWLYFPEADIPFSRVSVPGNFMPHRSREGKSVFCVEFPCDAGDEIWKANAADLAQRADETLLGSGLVRSRSVDALAVRIREGYPLYRIGYERPLEAVISSLRSFDNCLTTGRQGLFRHNNLDQSIQMGLLAADSISERTFDCAGWYDNLSQFNDYRIID